MEAKKLKTSETQNPAPPPTPEPPALEPPTPEPQASGFQAPGHYWELRWNEGIYSSRYGYLDEDQFRIKPEKCPIKWKVFRELTPDSFIIIGLQRVDTEPWTVRAKFHFRVENHKEECFFEDGNEIIFTPNECYRHIPYLRPPLANQRLEWLNSVNLIAKILVENCCLNDDSDVILSADVLGENSEQFRSNFKCLLNNSEFTDVILRLEEENFPAHKCVLSVRSPVLREMIQKSQDSTVPISNMERHILEEFLSFLYTDSLFDTKRKTVLSLIPVAYEYNVESLKKTCSFVLISYLRNDTAFEILKLADSYNDQSLKDAAEEHIVKNFKAFDSSSEWFELKETHSSLASSINEKVSRLIAIN